MSCVSTPIIALGIACLPASQAKHVMCFWPAVCTSVLMESLLRVSSHIDAQTQSITTQVTGRQKLRQTRGRIMAAQFSVACGLPLSIILLKGLPTEDAQGFMDSLAPRYALVMSLFGLLIQLVSNCLLRHSRAPLRRLLVLL